MDAGSDPGDPDGGPFGRPLFDKPSVRALRRVGVVDVGSNSVRLVVFDGAARSPAYFYNEKIMCGLGAGMSETGQLNPEGRVRALDALKRFHRLSIGLETGPLTVVATAAVREATDGPAFCEDVRAATGLRVWVVDGREEARLSAQGVLLGWPGSYGLVCDIGGSSMELAEIEGGRVGRRVSSALGPLKLRDIKGGRKARRSYIQDVVGALSEKLGEQKNRLFLVGGSWRAIAKIDMERRDYPLHVLHEYRMQTRELRKTFRYIEEEDANALRQRAGVSSGRMALVPQATEVLNEVLHTFRPRDIAVSSYGIREGLLYGQMPQALRDRDPLIEACRFMETKDARLPGFGKTLYRFIQPIFRALPPERMRLVKAACLLHDVSWRAHPDYRAGVCFDTATRANLGGLKHSERVFLGLALLHRYSNDRSGTRFGELNTLVDERTQHEAEVLGKAMRFGAMLWLKKDAELGEMRWSPRKKVLELRLSAAASQLFGEVAEARFLSLVKTLGAEPVIRKRA
ncbi:Ppx/GppA family phosphatase [Roseovarius spongiae]|uniref:Ppx/GppA family phosphatase n=1 Tax=Roseovarius spongiae TaxID=2320272 RepID=A0A3A8B9I3_9RHOB|nr:Ppx/GppA family phosphatase [Roseovarius spongiae]RKF14925.1 Ppx/GppA family phosphatase [Roseovarius spongiae]